ncbi:cell division protein FtsQ/DivIB [Terrihabitans sp. B22-R8]|uniref:cell division protein FtsQ/DivIB n=1 Tax=Terrihabitans sp. B22-R8 TaxID=3425128 RepID=UPI00403CDC51
MDGGKRFPEQIDGPARVAGARPQSSWTGFRKSRPQRRRDGAVAVLTRPGMGWVGVVLLFGATGLYGATAGEHWTEVGEFVHSIPEGMARGSGFTIARIEVEGRKVLTNDELIQALGYEPGQSLVGLDVGAARESLLKNPLVKQASVRKLYPDRLTVKIVEREPFALWQQGESLSVIASDGTVIEGAPGSRFAHLPLVVGRGADSSAKEILSALQAHPELRERVYAAVRVGERRWNLRLKNGMDIKLPDHGVEDALARVARLDRDHKITDRDITELDLRLPGRATVRLSEPVAKALAEAAKDKTKRAGT